MVMGLDQHKHLGRTRLSEPQAVGIRLGAGLAWTSTFHWAMTIYCCPSTSHCCGMAPPRPAQAHLPRASSLASRSILPAPHGLSALTERVLQASSSPDSALESGARASLATSFALQSMSLHGLTATSLRLCIGIYFPSSTSPAAAVSNPHLSSPLSPRRAN